MRLLIVTQKIDEQDAVLGFMHGWVLEFARQAESVSIICLEKGRVNLPENVNVFSLGKENYKLQTTNYEPLKKLKYAARFVRYIVQMRNQYDAVFVHMNPEYVVLGGLFWKWWGKTVTLWYAHKSTPWHLRLALLFTDIVFTSTASGFRLPSKKVRVVGQGIDTEKFKTQNSKLKIEEGENKFRIISVGRITPSKDYDTLIGAIEVLRKNSETQVHVMIFGPTSIASDELYLKHLKEKIAQKGLSGFITFEGPVANKDLPNVLSEADLFVNMGLTGSLDKAVPEAMAVGIPVLTCNEAFKEVLGAFKGDLMYPKGDIEALAFKIKEIMGYSLEKRGELGRALRELVLRNHSLTAFAGKITSNIIAIRITNQYECTNKKQ